MFQKSLERRFYSAPKYRGTTRFYSLIRDQIGPDSTVLNLGAGPATRDPIRIIKGTVARVAGADIDPIVLENDELDDGVVFDGVSLPFPDAEFDLVFSDYVLEHVAEPAKLFAEIARVLKPGGSYFFRTPNLLHYVALGSYATPQWFHRLTANRMRGLSEQAHEPWPTHYRANRPSTLRKLARQAGFSRTELTLLEMEPSYLRFHWLPYLGGIAYERLVNSTSLLKHLRGNLFGRLVK